MDEILQLLEMQILGNSLKRYFVALLVFIASMIILKVIERFLTGNMKKLAEKNTFGINPAMVETFQKLFLPLLAFGAFYFALTQLQLDPALARFVRGGAVIYLSIQIARISLIAGVAFVEDIWLKKQAQENALAFRSVLTLIRIGIWGMCAIFILDNLGFNVSAVIAGLGIGGVAVALAAQHILGDLFNYSVIFFDRPFVHGDAISAGEIKGTIEHIGIKTTRIRAVDGELLVCPNTTLTSSNIRNHKKMTERRCAFKLGVTYQTTSGQLKKMPALLRALITRVPGTRFEYARFQSFGDSALIFEVIYFVMTGDHHVFMDVQERINLDIKDTFEREGIEFAYPTQTLYAYTVPSPVK